MVGQTLLHYHILKKLGEDGVGQIYLAEDTELNRPVTRRENPERLRLYHMAGWLIMAIHDGRFRLSISIEPVPVKSSTALKQSFFSYILSRTVFWHVV